MLHRLTVCVAITALIGVSACQQASPDQPAPSSDGQAQAPSEALAVRYACGSGVTIEARYPNKTSAQMTYKGQDYVLRNVQAASGARYIGSGVEWWTTSRDGREVATLSLLSPNEEVAVSVLEQCARPLTAPAPDLTTGITPPQPKPDLKPIPAQGGVLPASAPCKGPQLKMAVEDGDAGAGNRVRNFSLQNVGTNACTLTGYPGVNLLDGRGQAVNSVRADQSPGSYFRQGQAPTPVDLAPQAKAYFEVAWNVIPNEAAGQKTCPNVATVRATAPGDTAAISQSFAFQPCGGKIRVSPIRSASALQPAT
ncbi:Membrane-bound lysozyme-inhibitor of c-type lysozyme [Brevundimonas sp. SH203]|uniref:DUF4232 domain-containing protein n=1 Tax=Brevundimonas sp. SH203 TaxID=345167 RepID=UPI0009CBE736|nr:DUF4232 domain-containing protein [Brevundimonas sp. SH203]GAW42495.1 Membrane-bound lysozyme-inhibitor of c-type lysozyme [Brevundimonas sp. SH203]